MAELRLQTDMKFQHYTAGGCHTTNVTWDIKWAYVVYMCVYMYAWVCVCVCQAITVRYREEII